MPNITPTKVIGGMEAARSFTEPLYSTALDKSVKLTFIDALQALN